MMRVYVGYDDKGKVVKVTISLDMMSKYIATGEVCNTEPFNVELEEANLDDSYFDDDEMGTCAVHTN